MIPSVVCTKADLEKYPDMRHFMTVRCMDDHTALIVDREQFAFAEHKLSGKSDKKIYLMFSGRRMSIDYTALMWRRINNWRFYPFIYEGDLFVLGLEDIE